MARERAREGAAARVDFHRCIERVEVGFAREVVARHAPDAANQEVGVGFIPALQACDGEPRFRGAGPQPGRGNRRNKQWQTGRETIGIVVRLPVDSQAQAAGGKSACRRPVEAVVDAGSRDTAVTECHAPATEVRTPHKAAQQAHHGAKKGRVVRVGAHEAELFVQA